MPCRQAYLAKVTIRNLYFPYGHFGSQLEHRYYLPTLLAAITVVRVVCLESSWEWPQINRLVKYISDCDCCCLELAWPWDSALRAGKANGVGGDNIQLYVDDIQVASLDSASSGVVPLTLLLEYCKIILCCLYVAMYSDEVYTWVKY